MMRSSRIVWVLLLTACLIAFPRGGSLLMASSGPSHATHFVSLRGPQLAQEEAGCYVCHADGRLQCQGAPIFADSTIVDGVVVVPQFLETTAVCDDCHSDGGAFPGGVDPLWDPDIGAKANWESGVYDSQFEVLPYWQESTEYEPGDIIKHLSNVYVCIADFSFISGDEPNGEYWKAISPWQPSTQYFTGDLVGYFGKVYRSRRTFTSCNPDPCPETYNWELVKRTGSGKESLLPGKEKWCATCHDDEPANSKANLTGVKAPNVVGDGSTYGFYLSGHGRAAIEEIGMTAIGQECLDCHNSTFAHIDHEHRTYQIQKIPYAVMHAYKDSYRLKRDMAIPEPVESAETAFKLCINDQCHTLSNITSPGSHYETNFRHGSAQYHEKHLVQYGAASGPPGHADWDSDWDGCTDAAMSCPSCHNIHGSPMEVNGELKPNPVMTRHGELISTPDSWPLDKVPAIDIRWQKVLPPPGGLTETNVLEDSIIGIMNGGIQVEDTPCVYYVSGETGNHVCMTCHSNGPSYSRTPGGPEEIYLLTVWVSDLNNTPYNYNFRPGDPIRYHVNFRLSGPPDEPDNYWVEMLPSETGAYNNSSMPGTDWEDLIEYGNYLARDQYHDLYFDRTVPLEATQPSQAKFRVNLRMYDTDGGTQLDDDLKVFTFNIIQ